MKSLVKALSQSFYAVSCSSFSITDSSSSGATFSKQLKHFSLSGRGPQRQHSQNTKHDMNSRAPPMARAAIQTISKIVLVSSSELPITYGIKATHLFFNSNISNDHYSISVFYTRVEHTNTITVITEPA